MQNLAGWKKWVGWGEGESAGLVLPCWVGKLKQGSDPHIGAIVWDRGETFEAESEAVDL